MLLKTVVLSLLVFQTTLLVLLIKASTKWNRLYIKSTVVCTTEIVKFLISYTNMVIIGKESLNIFSSVHRCIFLCPLEILKILIPSLCYVLQNNLLHYAIERLDAPIFQVLYQMKTLTTAFFSYIFLGRVFSRRKMTALIVLTVGVILVEKDNHYSPQAAKTKDQTMGFLAVVLASITSGLCGVYFERLIKRNPDIWRHNFQIAFVSIWLSLGMSLYNDGEMISRNGFFSNYSPTVVLIIIMQAFGGLIVSFVMKYADNILKSFGTAVSTLFISVLSATFLDSVISRNFVLGSLLVIASIFIYSV